MPIIIPLTNEGIERAVAFKRQNSKKCGTAWQNIQGGAEQVYYRIRQNIIVYRYFVENIGEEFQIMVVKPCNAENERYRQIDNYGNDNPQSSIIAAFSSLRAGSIRKSPLSFLSENTSGLRINSPERTISSIQ